MSVPPAFRSAASQPSATDSAASPPASVGAAFGGPIAQSSASPRAVAPAFSVSQPARPTAPSLASPDWKSKASELVDRYSEQVARLATEKTGRETTPGEVRTIALYAGGAVACLTGLFALLVVGAMIESAVLSSGDAGRSSSGGGSGASAEWDDSFESKMVRGFHEQGGSLNYTTEPNNP